MHVVDQKILSASQIEQFHHDEFVENQTSDFINLTSISNLELKNIVDIGGGVGHFAEMLHKISDFKVRVIDLDPTSVEACAKKGIHSNIGDALKPNFFGDEDVVCFNMILHHLIGKNDDDTRYLQLSALKVWQDRTKAVFVNEYIYDSSVRGFSGWLIFKITSSSVLSAAANSIARFVPSLFANTFGVGVRFRSHDEWVEIFEDAGYEVTGYRKGLDEYVPLPRRLLLIKSWRKDSFFITPLRHEVS